MPVFQATVLGLLQGLAEFLPISSSAHLTLAPWAFGWQDPGLAFDVALHFGTLVAVLWYFRREWAALVAAAWRMVTRRSPSGAHVAAHEPEIAQAREEGVPARAAGSSRAVEERAHERRVVY